MGITYRLHTREDEAALLNLWCEHGQWDKIDAQEWAERLLRPPFGEAAIVVAEDGDSRQVVGQFAFIPSRVSVDGRDVSALRPFAPIMSPAARGSLRNGNPFHHPIPAMYMYAVKALRKRGDGLIYMVPDTRWLRFFRMFPFLTCGSFPLWSLPLPLARDLPLPAGYRAGPVSPAEPDVDALWEKARRLHGCTVVRSTQILPWKVGRGDYHLLGIRRGGEGGAGRGGELVGLVASRQKGDRQWLICDMLCADADGALSATLAAVTNFAHAQALAAPPAAPIRKVALLTTPVLEPAVRALGFARDAYDFPMVVHVLDETITREQVAPSRWYVSPND